MSLVRRRHPNPKLKFPIRELLPDPIHFVLSWCYHSEGEYETACKMQQMTSRHTKKLISLEVEPLRVGVPADKYLATHPL